MSLINTLPPQKTSQRIGHWCPEDALRYYGKNHVNIPQTYQPPRLTGVNKSALAMEERGVRQNGTYESHVYTQAEAIQISPLRKGKATNNNDDLCSVKTTSTITSNFIPKNVQQPLPKKPKGAMDLVSDKAPIERFFKKRYDPNRHDKKTFLENETQSISSKFETDVGAPKGYLGPNPRHQLQGVRYEKPGFNCVTLKMENVPEKFNMKDEIRNMASKGHVV